MEDTDNALTRVAMNMTSGAMEQNYVPVTYNTT